MALAFDPVGSLAAVDWNHLPEPLAAAAVWAALGVLILVVSFVIIDKCTPGNMWKEIIEEKNTAVATLMGLMAVAIAIIIAAAIQG